MRQQSDTSNTLRLALVRQLRPLRALSPMPGVGLVLWHFGLAAAAAFGCAAAIRVSNWGWILLPPIVLLIGTRMRALGNVIHECSHYSFVRSRRWNRILGQVLCIADLSSFNTYQKEHLTHHRNTGDFERDLDLAARRDLHLERPVRNLLLDCLTRALSPRTVRAVFKPSILGRDDPWFINAARAVWLVLVSAACITSPVPMMLYLVLPYLTTYQMLKAWSDCIDHAGLIEAPEEFDRSRNHIFSLRALNWLFLPRNDAYHLVHHLFPKLPTKYYESVHQSLLKYPAYASREHSLRWQDVTPVASTPGERNVAAQHGHTGARSLHPR